MCCCGVTPVGNLQVLNMSHIRIGWLDCELVLAVSCRRHSCPGALDFLICSRSLSHFQFAVGILQKLWTVTTNSCKIRVGSQLFGISPRELKRNSVTTVWTAIFENSCSKFSHVWLQQSQQTLARSWTDCFPVLWHRNLIHPSIHPHIHKTHTRTYICTLNSNGMFQSLWELY